jgi:hypothetical protein
MSAPACKISDELVAQQTLSAVASALHEAINVCSNPDSCTRRRGCFGKLGVPAKSATARVTTFSPSSTAGALCTTRPRPPSRPADLLAGSVAASLPVNGNDLPTVRRRETGAACSVDRVSYPTISDTTTPRANGRFCASSLERSNAAAFATCPSIRLRRSRASVGRRYRPLCTRLDG